MPTRSLRSSVLRWPDVTAVDAAIRQWSAEQAAAHPPITRIGYFGSYARGDWGVGSDLDVVVIVEAAEEPFERRGLDLDAAPLPVPTDIVVYSRLEWEQLQQRPGFGATIADEVQWVYQRA